jgi:imidazole glycerol-phosphate synthase subunit HisF
VYGSRADRFLEQIDSNFRLMDMKTNNSSSRYLAPLHPRLIARLDLKMEHLIKGVQMEGWRKVGIPAERALKYYDAGIDELIYMDVVASLYDRNSLHDIIRSAAEEIFVPITVGGGIRKLEDAADLLAVGADKVAINTGATKDPDLISRLSDTYGSQATVLSIEAKSQPDGSWEVMTDNGRNRTGLDAVAWAVKGAQLGAGEIIVLSIDRDGTSQGMDLALINSICQEVDVPVIASGGIGKEEQIAHALIETGVSGVAVAKALHLDQISVTSARSAMTSNGLIVRELEGN